jgi:hypothetical protein
MANISSGKTWPMSGAAIDLMDDDHGRPDSPGRQHGLRLAEKREIASCEIVDIGAKLGHLGTSRKLPHSFIGADVGLLSSRR